MTIRNQILSSQFIVGALFLSALVVGLGTVPPVVERWREELENLEWVLMAIFVTEIALRIGAHSPRPWRFFHKPWNVFDFAVTALCLLPMAQFVVVLRLARVVRVFRLFAPIQESDVIRKKNEELAAALHALEIEKAKSERLLLNILPLLISQRLKENHTIIADRYEDASVLFADIVGFTDLSHRIPAEQLVAILDGVFTRFDQLVDQHGLEKIKTIGDAYMTVSGVPVPRADHLEAVARLALGMQLELEEFNRATGQKLSLRIGIHAGPVVAGVIGRKKFIYDLWGDTVNTASRMESHGQPGRIHVSEEVMRRLDGKFSFEPRGVTDIKGKGPMSTFFLSEALD